MSILEQEETEKPLLGAIVFYRGQNWTIVGYNESRKTADIKLPESTRKHDTSLTLAWKDLRYPKTSEV